MTGADGAACRVPRLPPPWPAAQTPRPTAVIGRGRNRGATRGWSFPARRWFLLTPQGRDWSGGRHRHVRSLHVRRRSPGGSVLTIKLKGFTRSRSPTSSSSRRSDYVDVTVRVGCSRTSSRCEARRRRAAARGCHGRGTSTHSGVAASESDSDPTSIQFNQPLAFRSGAAASRARRSFAAPQRSEHLQADGADVTDNVGTLPRDVAVRGVPLPAERSRSFASA